jgi:hypothetical protein
MVGIPAEIRIGELLNTIEKYYLHSHPAAGNYKGKFVPVLNHQAAETDTEVEMKLHPFI